MNKIDFLKILGNVAIVSVVAFIGYKIYERYKEADQMVSDTFEKINLGVGEMTEFLKNKNKELDEKIKEKRENIKG